MARSYSAVPLPCDPSPSPRSHGPVRAAHNEAAKDRRTFAFARQVAAAVKKTLPALASRQLGRDRDQPGRC